MANTTSNRSQFTIRSLLVLIAVMGLLAMACMNWPSPAYKEEIHTVRTGVPLTIIRVPTNRPPTGIEVAQRMLWGCAGLVIGYAGWSFVRSKWRTPRQ